MVRILVRGNKYSQKYTHLIELFIWKYKAGKNFILILISLFCYIHKCIVLFTIVRAAFNRVHITRPMAHLSFIETHYILINVFHSRRSEILNCVQVGTEKNYPNFVGINKDNNVCVDQQQTKQHNPVFIFGCGTRIQRNNEDKNNTIRKHWIRNHSRFVIVLW